MRELFQIGRSELAFVLKRDADDRTDPALRVANGNRHSSLGIHGFGAGFDIAGFVFLQVAGLDGFAAQ